MVNYSKVIQGIVFFIMASLFSIIIYLVGFNMMESLSTDGDEYALDTTEQAIIWTAMIIIWILLLVILPAHFIIEGLKEPS